MNLTKAAADVFAERRRQIEAEGWTPEHDDKYQGRELVRAAISYAMSAAAARYSVFAEAPSWWPWDRSWWKPKNRRRDLVRSAALLIAEIEHIDRATGIAALPFAGIKEGDRVACIDFGIVQSIDDEGTAEVLWDISGCIGDITMDRLRPVLSAEGPANG